MCRGSIARGKRWSKPRCWKTAQCVDLSWRDLRHGEIPRLRGQHPLHSQDSSSITAWPSAGSAVAVMKPVVAKLTTTTSSTSLYVASLLLVEDRAVERRSQTGKEKSMGTAPRKLPALYFVAAGSMPKRGPRGDSSLSPTRGDARLE